MTETPEQFAQDVAKVLKCIIATSGGHEKHVTLSTQTFHYHEDIAYAVNLIMRLAESARRVEAFMRAGRRVVWIQEIET